MGKEMLTLYVPRSLPVPGTPSPARQSGHTHFTCFTVLPGSWAMMLPRLALLAVAVPLLMVKLRLVS